MALLGEEQVEHGRVLRQHPRLRDERQVEALGQLHDTHNHHAHHDQTQLLQAAPRSPSSTTAVCLLKCEAANEVASRWGQRTLYLYGPMSLEE